MQSQTLWFFLRVSTLSHFLSHEAVRKVHCSITSTGKLLRALENRQQVQGNEGDSTKSERTPPC